MSHGMVMKRSNGADSCSILERFHVHLIGDLIGGMGRCLPRSRRHATQQVRQRSCIWSGGKVDCSHNPNPYSMGSFSEAQLAMRW